MNNIKNKSHLFLFMVLFIHLFILLFYLTTFLFRQCECKRTNQGSNTLVKYSFVSSSFLIFNFGTLSYIDANFVGKLGSLIDTVYGFICIRVNIRTEFFFK
ncbi:hypothetical protein H8356DRAFT_1306621 [Neocallimastix lanati (nom. inval.)]|nr:hypothetical protein H8356DRAFT_1306621 [Neocallimastix sp. JGI-2020a]